MGGVLSFKNLWSVVQEKVQPDFAGASDVAVSGGGQRAKKVLEYFDVRGLCIEICAIACNRLYSTHSSKAKRSVNTIKQRRNIL